MSLARTCPPMISALLLHEREMSAARAVNHRRERRRASGSGRPPREAAAVGVRALANGTRSRRGPSELDLQPELDHAVRRQIEEHGRRSRIAREEAEQHLA